MALKYAIDLFAIVGAFAVGTFITRQAPGIRVKKAFETYAYLVNAALAVFLFWPYAGRPPFWGVDPYLMVSLGIAILAVGIRDFRRGATPGALCSTFLALFFCGIAAGIFAGSVAVAAVTGATGILGLIGTIAQQWIADA